MKRYEILALNLALRPKSPVKIFPIGLAYVLSSILRAGFEFDLIDIDADRLSDEQLYNKLQAKKWDIVLLGCIVTGYRIVKRISSYLRETNPNALIVVGNSVASSIPEILLTKTQADVAVIGEGDITAVEVLRKWKTDKSLEGVDGIYYKQNGKIVKTKPRSVIPDINQIPPPIYEIFNVEEFIRGQQYAVNDPLPMDRGLIRSFPINASRGCVSRCTFCYHCFIGTRFRYKTAETIVEEMKLLKTKYDINYFMLWDDLTFFSRKQARNFTEALLKEKLQINWVGTIRGNLFQQAGDLDLLKRMRDSGCLDLGYSLESASEEILAAMKKNLSLDQFRKQKMLLDKAEIASSTSIVLGYPQETVETIAKTYQFCLDLGIYPSSGFLLPQPETPIYEWARREGLIKDEEEYLLRMGDRQDLRINLTQMTDEEFLGSVNYWLRRLNKEMALGLRDDELVKTMHYRSRSRESRG